MKLLLLLPGAALACTWPSTTIKILPLNNGWSFCCPGLDGTKAHAAMATYSSVNNDDYSVRPGISSSQLTRCAGRARRAHRAPHAARTPRARAPPRGAPS